MIEVKHKAWDSDFFGLRIGTVELHSKDDSSIFAQKKEELRKNYDLIYVFDPNHVGFDADDAKLVDEKVLYIKTCEQKYSSNNIVMYSFSMPDESLYHLAHISGKYSRFKLDEKFPAGCFERMYDRWIENACPKEGENKQIFIYNQDGNAKGMITIDYSDELAHIGLVAVDEKCQHLGIGTKIMNSVEAYLFDLKTVKTLEVPTQKANIDACRWYEKTGFSIKSVIDVYHWWL